MEETPKPDRGGDEGKGIHGIKGFPEGFIDWNDSRTIRQMQSVDRWVAKRLKATIIGFVGFGKSNIGLMAIRRLLNAKPEAEVLVIVPSEPVGKQWKKLLAECTSPFERIRVMTMKKAAKDYRKLDCNLLVIDEVHKAATPSMRNCLKIPHNFILCLTATFERLDGRHKYVEKFAPVADRITLAEGVKNGWTSSHNIYCVLCSTGKDTDEYVKLSQKFREAFEYFNFDFDAPKMIISDKDYRKKWLLERVNEYCKAYGIETSSQEAVSLYKAKMGEMMKNAKAFLKTMIARRDYIYHHPVKLKIAEKIIEAYKDKKGITFWCSIEDAKKVKYGKAYTSDDGKEGQEILEEFLNAKSGVINTVRKLNEGFNCPEIEYGIMAGFNSSKTMGEQQKGRVVRINDLTKNKKAKVFYITLKGTQDVVWMNRALDGVEYLTILEEDLDAFLRGEDIDFAPNPKGRG